MKTHAVSEESLLMAMCEAVDGLVEPQGTAGYVRESSVFNTSAVPLPAAVVVPRDAKDLARAVRTAVSCGFTVAVQSTGHAATAVDSRSILVNTRMLDTLVIDPAAGTATVGAGVRWRDLLTAAGKHGLAGLAGSAPDVGVVGYTLGGGLGPVARTFGFAADHVVSVDVVTADGDLRTVDESRHPDLFWALRGGGGADRKSTRLNSSHAITSRMPSSA